MESNRAGDGLVPEDRFGLGRPRRQQPAIEASQIRHADGFRDCLAESRFTAADQAFDAVADGPVAAAHPLKDDTAVPEAAIARVVGEPVAAGADEERLV